MIGIFTIPLELAYGESRSPSTIPPNAIAKGKKWGNPKELDEVLGIQFCIHNLITLQAGKYDLLNCNMFFNLFPPQ